MLSDHSTSYIDIVLNDTPDCAVNAKLHQRGQIDASAGISPNFPTSLEDTPVLDQHEDLKKKSTAVGRYLRLHPPLRFVV